MSGTPDIGGGDVGEQCPGGFPLTLPRRMPSVVRCRAGEVVHCLAEGGEWFCNEDCREQRRQYLKVKHAGPDEFVAVVGTYHRYQDERHARIMREIEERRARNAAELAALNAAWEARDS